MQWLRPDSVVLNPETRSTLAARGVQGNLRRSQRNDPRHETRYRPGGNRDHCYGGVSRIIGALSGTIRPERLERRGINQKGRRSSIRPPPSRGSNWAAITLACRPTRRSRSIPPWPSRPIPVVGASASIAITKAITGSCSTAWKKRPRLAHRLPPCVYENFLPGAFDGTEPALWLADPVRMRRRTKGHCHRMRTNMAIPGLQPIGAHQNHRIRRRKPGQHGPRHHRHGPPAREFLCRRRGGLQTKRTLKAIGWPK